jgi:hypothetical protein
MGHLWLPDGMSLLADTLAILAPNRSPSHRRPLHRLAATWLAALLAARGAVVASTPASAAPRGTPAKSLATLDEEYAASEKDLLRRCEIDGHTDLAAIIGAWKLPVLEGRQLAVVIPAAGETPTCVDTEAEQSIWDDFLAARRARAAGCYEHAVFAAGAHDRRPSRAALARPDSDAPTLAQGSCEAIRLLFLALRDDPDLERARAAGGWVRRGDRWEWPEAARRLDRAEEYDPDFGWMAKGKLARYRDGERSLRGRWVKAAEDDATLREVKHGRQFDADHWEIITTAPPALTGELATALETTRLVWLQVFGAFSAEPAELEKRLISRGRVVPQTPHSAILCGNHDQYLAELRQLEPRIAVADGLYWQPTATAWFFADPAGPPDATVRHEGFHQLFAESRPDFLRLKAEPGRRAGFWAVEAAAIYAESIEQTAFGWTIGGRDAGRGPAVRKLLADDKVLVPLAELAAMGREAFQAHDQIADLYDQCGGWADFFMNASGGRYRESFVEYLTRVYSGTVDPDTLPRLCGRSFAELDAEYREYIR